MQHAFEGPLLYPLPVFELNEERIRVRSLGCKVLFTNVDDRDNERRPHEDPTRIAEVSACRGVRLELRLSLTTPIKQPLIETERHENRGISRWINKTIMEQLAVHDSDVASITTRGIAPGVRLSPPRSDTYSATSIRPRYADGSASTAGQFTGVACCPAQGVVSPQGSNSGPAESSSRQTRINDAAGETTVLVEPEWTTMTELVRQLLSHLVRTEHLRSKLSVGVHVPEARCNHLRTMSYTIS